MSEAHELTNGLFRCVTSRSSVDCNGSELLCFSRVSARGRAGVFQWTKGLAHLAEFAKRRVELVRLRPTRRCWLRRSPAAVPDVQEGEHSSDDKEGEGKSHFEYGGAAEL